MASTPQVSTKRVQVSKTTALIVGVIAAASFITVFSLIASRALLSQRAYQSRVISEKEKAKKQLEDDISAVNVLQTQYKAFVNTPANVLGGNPSGTGDKDGDNAHIILDALPSKYDFPALATSLEKILTNGGYTIESIAGTDDEVAQDTSTAQPNATPQPVPIPFQVAIAGNPTSIQGFIGVLEHSIRPIQVKTLSLDDSSGALHLSIAAQTYYQPTKSFTITTKEVK